MTSPRIPLLSTQDGFFDLAALEECADEFDADVAASPQIDHFCSSTYWAVPAAQELMPPRQAAIRRGPAGWLAFMQGEHPSSGRYLEPLEASWGLACPLIGPDPHALAEWLAECLRQSQTQWDLTLLAGLPVDSTLFRAVAATLSGEFRLLRHGRAGRHVASLQDGFEGFLSRRSRNFRRNATRAQARAATNGITFEHHQPSLIEDALAVFDRIQRVEATSWKGQDDVGIAHGPFGDFYRNMVPRLAKRQGLHVVFAMQGGREVGFLLGGVLGDTFRGLQVSFDESLRDLSLGNLCQLNQIARLPSHIAHYDLGSSGLAYKLNWAERTLETEILLVLPR